MSLNPLRRIPNLDDVAGSLDTYLTHDLAHHQRLALVAHSQGGLVVQRLLERMIANGRGRELARIRRIVLFACPNTGSDLALLLRRRACFWRHPQERELRPLAEAIARTHSIVVNQVIHARSVSESACPIRIIAYAGESDAVVTAASAKGVFPEVGELPGDHFSIIRPDSPTHRSFVALKKHLTDLPSDPQPPESAPEPAPVPEPEPEPRRKPDRRDPSPDRERDLGWERDLDWERDLVDKLLAVPRMADPSFRGQLYERLPPEIVNQLQRDSAARLELFALVTSFKRYRHMDPCSSLAEALSALVPDHPAVAAAVGALADASRRLAAP